MGKRPQASAGPFEQHNGDQERVSGSIGGVEQCQLSLGEDLSVVVVVVNNSLVDRLAEPGTAAGTDR